MKKVNLKTIAFSLFLALSVSSCSTDPNQDVGWLIDNSNGPMNANRDSSDKMFDYLIRNVLQLEEGEAFSGGIKVSILIMGESARPKVRLVYLEPGNHWLFEKTKVRLAKIEAFKEELKEALEEAGSKPLNQTQSYLHHAICYSSKIMIESHFSDNPKMYVFSDGIQNSVNMDFNEYILKLDEFEGKFPEISDQLNKDCQLPEMPNIEVSLVSSPVPGYNEQMLVFARFWQFHIESTGASFKSRSNLGY